MLHWNYNKQDIFIFPWSGESFVWEVSENSSDINSCLNHFLCDFWLNLWVRKSIIPKHDDIIKIINVLTYFLSDIN